MSAASRESGRTSPSCFPISATVETRTHASRWQCKSIFGDSRRSIHEFRNCFTSGVKFTIRRKTRFLSRWLTRCSSKMVRVNTQITQREEHNHEIEIQLQRSFGKCRRVGWRIEDIIGGRERGAPPCRGRLSQERQLKVKPQPKLDLTRGSRSADSMAEERRGHRPDIVSVLHKRCMNPQKHKLN